MCQELQVEVAVRVRRLPSIRRANLEVSGVNKAVARLVRQLPSKLPIKLPSKQPQAIHRLELAGQEAEAEASHNDNLRNRRSNTSYKITGRQRA